MRSASNLERRMTWPSSPRFSRSAARGPRCTARGSSSAPCAKRTTRRRHCGSSAASAASWWPSASGRSRAGGSSSRPGCSSSAPCFSRRSSTRPASSCFFSRPPGTRARAERGRRLGRLARRWRRRGRRRAAGLAAGAGLARPGTLVVLRLELRDEVRVAGALDDRVELRAVVGDEADALERDVVRPPALALREHAVVHGDGRALFRHDQGPDHGAVTVDHLAEVLDLLAGIILDLRDVRLLEQISEEARELLALRRGSRLPVQREAPPGDLAEIEDLVRHGADRPATLQRPPLFLELGAPRNFKNWLTDVRGLVLGR